MEMRMRIPVTIAALSLVMTYGASAQTAGVQSQAPKAAPPGPQAATQSPQAIAEELRQNLQNAGFSDIQLMPSSFLVRAKDRNGNPVMMVINPDSVTAITETRNGNQSSTVGQGPSNPNSTKK